MIIAKTTDQTLGKLLREDKPVRQRNEGATWGFVLYLAPIDNLWSQYGEDLDTVIVHRAYDAFTMLLDSKCSMDYACILHDRDIKDDGTSDKPHIHLIIKYNHKVSDKYAIKHINDMVGAICTECTYAEIIRDPRWYIEDYMIHNGYPDKYQYSPDDRTIHGTPWEKTYQDFLNLVMECDNFATLCMVCRDDKSLSKLLVKHCYFAKTFYQETNDARRDNSNNRRAVC